MTTESLARTDVDALHVELLDTLVKLTGHVENLKVSLPTVASDVDGFTKNIKAAFAEFHASTIALVGYIKTKQLETLKSLHDSQAVNTAETKKTLSGFERLIWLSAGLTGANFILLVALVFLR